MRTITPWRPRWRRRRARGSTSSGAWATRSATGRARIAAAPWSPPGLRSASPATTTSPSPASSRSTSSTATPPRRPAGHSGVLETGGAFVPRIPRAERVRPGVELFHGSPIDPVWDYVLSEAAAFLSFRTTKAPLLLVGHSHVALALSWDESSLGGGVAQAGEVDLGRGRWLLNPGLGRAAAGGDARAAWLLIDEETRRATFLRTPYPVEQTQAEIRERGLPEALAERLSRGV